ncbi:zinc finger protein 462-like [Betta splendens]|uniref:Zinc finger protein 462-like n=1 Tax=Betta splendens TaxID=158456 RepID=A0A6P7NGW6_BETSP|nr:zinc finger protein 462-like [Betta splendens]
MDSETLSTSGHMMHSQAAIEESPGKALQCSHCTLIFRSKVYLFEHLTNVHCFDVDKALREAGLKQAAINKANADIKRNSSGRDFLCQHCDFKTCQLDDLKEHERHCRRNTEPKKGFGYGNNPENPETKIPVTSRNQCKEGEGTKHISSFFVVSSTSKTKCLPNSSKDLKTQTITKYLTGFSGTRGKSPVMSSDSLPDCTKGTLILQESPTNSSGVFKVTAMSMIDIPKRVLEQDLTTDKSQKPKEEPNFVDNAVKRTIDEGTEDPPAKKSKSCKEEMKPLMNGKKQASGADISCEISEDDKSVHLVNGTAESPKLYFCKHCDYNDVSISCVSNHYQNDHPYIRFTSDYIQDPRDQSATFRCLECPVEFSAVPELKRHYNGNHPKAPDIIMMQSGDLSLVFRCFVCIFTSNELKALKEHYKVKHPTHKVDNSLLYCRYSVSRCQVASSCVNPCEKTPERPERNSPESAQVSCKEVRSATSPQHSISKPTRGTFYFCNKCNFSHKSVVVIRVHYQKSHPDEPVSIDKIKRSVVASPMTPEKSPNHATEVQTCTPQKNTSESLSSMNLAHTSEASPNYLKSPKLKEVDSAEDRRKARNSLSNYEPVFFAEIESSSNRVFYCRFCSYFSTNVRSVLGHHNAKHTEKGVTTINEVVSYSASMEKKKLQSQAKVPGDTLSSDSETPNQIDVKKTPQFEGYDSGDASVEESNAFECPEKLFYCQKCNYANPSLKGVVNHQIKLHRYLHSNKDCVLRHTALICEEIEKTKSATTELSCASRLPLPYLNEGDENALFCHFCNYRHSSMEQVVKHYFSRHRGSGITQERIRLHTSLILEKTQGLHQKMDNDLESSGEKTIQKEKSKKLAKGFSNLASVSQTPRVLKCNRCSYITPHLFVLRRHIWKIHRSNRTGPDLLRMCFRQGNIQSGYHCDLCVFSQKNAEALYEHYQEQHPERKQSLEYISTRLYVGPDARPLKNKKCKVKHTEGSLPSQTSVENEAKAYSCKACSFRGSSVSDITCHYRAVHPWSVKEDGSDPGVKINKKRCANGQLKEQNEILESFDTYQIPLEFDNSSYEARESDDVFSCSFCPAVFSTKHSLSTHCGMKHQGHPRPHQEKQVQIPTRVHVFKCPHCVYINSNYQGVITHCQMKHPALEVKADSFHLDKFLDDGLDQSSPVDGSKYRGYMCVACQQLCPTMEKLNKHSKNCHKMVNGPKQAPEASPARSMKQSKANSSQESISKTSFLRKKIYATIRCPHCSYSCTTKIGLNRHLLIRHGDSSVSMFRNFTYKCVLCFKLYCRKKRLGNHYIKKHGKDAYLKYYDKVLKSVPHKSLPASEDLSPELLESPSKQHKPSMKTGKKIIVYTCPGCPYVNASFHGTLTHCQMKHPDLVVRADELQTDEIFVNNMVMCTIGKGYNERGYMCNKCPQIHASLVKLRIHIGCDHRDEAEEQPDQSLMDPVLDNDFAETTQVKSRQQVDSPEMRRSNALRLQTKGLLYKCHMCMYAGSCRKYLYCHYKNTHKLDGPNMFKMLERYNIRKRKRSKLTACSAEESAQSKCKKCFNLTFSSPQQLISHYNTYHCKMDFTVLAKISKRSTGSYKCCQCKKVVHGIKNLQCHLDRHRARRMKAKAAFTQATFNTSTTPGANEKSELPSLETMELVRGDASPIETSTLPSPSKSTDQGHAEVESRVHGCKLCRRTFMSLEGLRLHERSHAALAAIKNLDNLTASALKQNINKHILYKPGTFRSFMCSFCSYRTTVLGLFRSHVMKNHRDVLVKAETTGSQDEKKTAKQPPYLTAENNNLPEPHIEPEMTEKSLYLEPPNVQRQLNQYSLMAQVGVSSKTNLQEPTLSESQLHCEFCNFTSEHLSSIRRHYQNRHGKKIFRCKDCDFLTGVRKTLEKHMETHHSSFRSETTHQKDPHCPFCLYQTKNKDNMIDHIVLHREERVVPIEVRRSKLSHYLQGIVFRCHKCTFTSGNAENLRLHMMRHDDIKPYKCRLCYFDCARLSDLEAHLGDKHQVMRNHELVGHVSLDQLEAVYKTPEEDDELLSNLEQENNDQDVETEEYDAYGNDILPETLAKNPLEHDIRAKTIHNLENEQDPQEQAVLLPNAASGQKRDVQFEDSTVPEKESQAESHGKAKTTKLSLRKKEAAEWNSTEHNEKAVMAPALAPHNKALKHEALEGGDVLHHMPVMGEKGSKKDGAVEMEQNSNTKVVDERENQLLNEHSNITACHSKGPVITEPNSEPNIKSQANNMRTPENPTVAQQSPTSTHCSRLKMSHKGNSGRSVANCKEEVVSITEKEMPVLEKVFHKEEMPVGIGKEEKDKEEEEGSSVKDEDVPNVHRGTAKGEPAEVCPSLTEKKLYTCKFCGRNLMNSQELTRHVMRHGM